MDSKDSIWIRLFLWLLGKVGCEQPVEEPAGQLPDPAPAKAPRHIGHGGGTRDPFAGYPEEVDPTIDADLDDKPDHVVTLEDPDAEARRQTTPFYDHLATIRDRLAWLPEGQLSERVQRAIESTAQLVEQVERALENGDTDSAGYLLRDASAECANIFAESGEGAEETVPDPDTRLGEVWDWDARHRYAPHEVPAPPVEESGAVYPMGEDADESWDPVDPIEAAAMIATSDHLPSLATLERDALRREEDVGTPRAGSTPTMVERVDDDEDEDDGEPMMPQDEPDIDAAMASSFPPFSPDRRVNMLSRSHVPRVRPGFRAAFAVVLLAFAGWFISIRLPSSPVLPTAPMTRVDVGAYATGDDDGDTEETPAAMAAIAELTESSTVVDQPRRTDEVIPSAPRGTSTDNQTTPTASTTAPSAKPTPVTVTAPPLKPLGPTDRQRLVRRH